MAVIRLSASIRKDLQKKISGFRERLLFNL
jgi:hypothetical protein